MSPRSDEYKPKRAVHPGEIIAEYLEALGKTQLWLAERMRRPPSEVNRLVRGHISVTVTTALQLERALKRPAQLWLNLQTKHDLHIARERGLS